ncbi:hypothetical protein [Dapis sp. BLCC M126]
MESAVIFYQIGKIAVIFDCGASELFLLREMAMGASCSRVKKPGLSPNI